ncbi:hypothetical protein BHM03_00049873 [Ensete ventricosum]|nr:hypothetical protein BHM03_00049873 [Ensete ventricosum]
MKGYGSAGAGGGSVVAPPASKRRWKGQAAAVLALVVFSLLVPLAFLLGLHNRFPSGYRYTNRPLPGGTTKIDRRRSIEGEKRRIKWKRRKKKKRRRKKKTSFPRAILARAPSPPAVLARGRFFSRTRRQNVSPRREKDRGDMMLLKIWIEARFEILSCTAWYGRYIPVRQFTGTRTAHYRMVPSKIDRRRSIEGDRRKREEEEEEEKKKKKKKKRRRRNKTSTVVARAPSLAPRRRPRVARALSPSALAGDFSLARGDGTSPRVGRKIEG